MNIKRGNNRIIGGVCSGLAESIEIQVIYMRLLVIAISLFLFPFTVFIYVLLWIIIKEEPVKTTKIKEDLSTKTENINEATSSMDENPDQISKSTSKSYKYLLQTIGFIVGGIIGFYFGYSIGEDLMGGDKSAGIVVILMVLFRYACWCHNGFFHCKNDC